MVTVTSTLLQPKCHDAYNIKAISFILLQFSLNPPPCPSGQRCSYPQIFSVVLPKQVYAIRTAAQAIIHNMIVKTGHCPWRCTSSSFPPMQCRRAKVYGADQVCINQAVARNCMSTGRPIKRLERITLLRCTAIHSEKAAALLLCRLLATMANVPTNKRAEPASCNPPGKEGECVAHHVLYIDACLIKNC